MSIATYHYSEVAAADLQSYLEDELAASGGPFWVVPGTEGMDPLRSSGFAVSSTKGADLTNKERSFAVLTWNNTARVPSDVTVLLAVLSDDLEATLNGAGLPADAELVTRYARQTLQGPLVHDLVFYNF